MVPIRLRMALRGTQLTIVSSKTPKSYMCLDCTVGLKVMNVKRNVACFGQLKSTDNSSGSSRWCPAAGADMARSDEAP